MSLIKEHAFKIEYRDINNCIVYELVIAGTFERAIKIANERIEESGTLKSITSITNYFPPVIRESTKTITINV